MKKKMKQYFETRRNINQADFDRNTIMKTKTKQMFYGLAMRKPRVSLGNFVIR